MSEQRLEKEEEFITVQVTVEDFVRQAVYDSVVNLVEQLRCLNRDVNMHIPAEKWMAKWKQAVLFRYPDEEAKDHA